MIGSKESWLKEVLISEIQDNKQEMIDIIRTNFAYEERLEKIIICLSDFAQFLTSQNVQEILNVYPMIEKNYHIEKSKYEEEILNFIQLGIKDQYFKSTLKSEFILELVNAYLYFFIKIRDSVKVRENVQLALKCLLEGVKNG